jgi:hypothetical protein
MPRSTLQELRDLVRIAESTRNMNLSGLAREARVQAAAKALTGKKAK